MKYTIYTLLLVALSLFSNQNAVSQSIYWKQRNVPKMPALQSYAWGNINDEYVFIGGRRDGLHPKQPWVSFHPDFRNDSIYVVNTSTNTVTAAGLQYLPVELKEQLCSSNMQFAQAGDDLTIVGGYGYSAAIDDKKTFDALIVVNLRKLIAQVKSNSVEPGAFFYYQNDQFAVCGGQLEKLNDWYYLIGGHRFDGSYNPKGNPTFVQTYTAAIRKFRIFNSPKKQTPEIVFAPDIKDERMFRRRDYNLAPTRYKNGKDGLMIFSGVFQPTTDMPFRSVVELNGDQYLLRNNFYQYFNHYHSAHLDFYDSTTDIMHHYFIGGLSEYYIEKNQLKQDSNVPFTKLVSHITRNELGELREYYLKEELPLFMGAGSHFIPSVNVKQFANGVIDLSATLGTADSVLLGFVVGGITADERNVFWSSVEGEKSKALNQWIEIYYSKSDKSEILHSLSSGVTGLECYTNNDMNEFNVEFTLDKKADIVLQLLSINEKGEKNVIGLSELPALEPGFQEFLFEFENKLPAGEYEFIYTRDGIDTRIAVFIG